MTSKLLDLLKKPIVLIGLALLLGVAIGRYATPVRIKTVEKEKIVTVVQKDTDKTTDKKNTTHEQIIKVKITHPDGTIEEREETIKDANQIVDVDLHTTTNTSTEIDKSKETIKDSTKPNWLIAGTAGVSFANKGLDSSYGIHVQRRILGPIFIGVYGNTTNQYGISAGLEF